jgi:hypothetical protein
MDVTSHSTGPSPWYPLPYNILYRAVSSTRRYVSKDGMIISTSDYTTAFEDSIPDASILRIKIGWYVRYYTQKLKNICSD